MSELKFKDYKYNVYYVFLLSDKSFGYQRFEDEKDMNDYINKEHSPINIARFVLDSIGEDNSFKHGLLDDKIFAEIQNTLTKNFNQEIRRNTTRTAKYSEEFNNYVLNRGNSDGQNKTSSTVRRSR